MNALKRIMKRMQFALHSRLFSTTSKPKHRVFYRHWISHDTPTGKPTGMTFRIELSPECRWLTYSVSVCSLKDQFSRSVGRKEADVLWEDGKTVHVLYSKWPVKYNTLEMIYDSLTSKDWVEEIIITKDSYREEYPDLRRRILDRFDRFPANWRGI